MKFNSIFLIALVSVAVLVRSESAFERVNNLLTALDHSIDKEQHDADSRNVKNVQWCKDEIERLTHELEVATSNWEEINKHIAFLNNEIQEALNAQKSREERIQKNIETTNKYKEQRCENNLLFVKTLREHMQGVRVMQLLRADIVDYFASKKQEQEASQSGPAANAGAESSEGPVLTDFIEQFTAFSHLLDSKHKQILIQLKNELDNLTNVDPLNQKVNEYTTTRGRTAEEVGDDHVDNDRAALQRLDTPEFTEASVYNVELQNKLLQMIDNLIKHLQDSREELIDDEIQAAQDFAEYQDATMRENEDLKREIEQLKLELVELNAKLTVAQEQEVKRRQIKEDAQVALDEQKNVCENIKNFYEQENKRRSGEKSVLKTAIEIFNSKILGAASERVKNRASAHNSGANVNDVEALNQHVATGRSEDENTLRTRSEGRNAVVF